VIVMPKCYCLVLDRNHAELHKKASWESTIIKVNRGFRKEPLSGFIPDTAKPLELHKRHGSIPLWVVNRKSLKALTLKEASKAVLKLKGNPTSKVSSIVGLTLTDKTDIDADTKLNLLTKKAFWDRVAEKLKMTKMDMLIWLCAGYGILRLAEFAIMYMFTGE